MAGAKSRSPLVGVVMGSRSDWETLRHAAEILTDLEIPHETRIVSAHRTPERLYRYGQAAEGRGLEILIAGAGGAAHLPGMLAALTLLPVLGVPVESKVLRGVDSLLSIVQMPRGIPVGHPGHRPRRRGQRRLARRRDAVPDDIPRSATPWPPSARPRPTPSGSRPNEPGTRQRRAPSPGVPGGRRRRPARPDVRPGRPAPRLQGRLPRRCPPTTPRRRWRAGRSSAARPSAALCAIRRAGRGRHRRVRERLGPRPAMARPESSRPAGLADRPGQPGSAPREGLPRQARHPARPLAAGAIRGRTGDGGRGARGSLDPQDGRLGLRRQGAGPRRSPRRRPRRLGAVAGRSPAWPRGSSSSPPRSPSIVARGADGRAVVYPIALNRHRRHILDATTMPAPIGPVATQEARDPGPRRSPRRWGPWAS